MHCGERGDMLALAPAISPSHPLTLPPSLSLSTPDSPPASSQCRQPLRQLPPFSRDRPGHASSGAYPPAAAVRSLFALLLAPVLVRRGHLRRPPHPRLQILRPQSPRAQHCARGPALRARLCAPQPARPLLPRARAADLRQPRRAGLDRVALRHGHGSECAAVSRRGFFDVLGW